MSPTTAPPAFQIITLKPTGKEGHNHLQSRQYQVRRSHAKSKAGCCVCKARRVKCDEAKPSCVRCQRAKVTCSYNPASDSGSDSGSRSRSPSAHRSGADSLTISEHSTPSPSPSDDLLLRLTNTSNLLFGLPSPTEASGSSPPSPSRGGTSRPLLLQHFQHVFSAHEIFRPISEARILTLSLSKPHLLSAMLAVSASHLRQHTSVDAVIQPAHRIAEHTEQSLAIRAFHEALSVPAADPLGADAMLLTSMLLNVLAFTHVENEEDPLTSWVFSTEENKLSWLAVQMGLKPLLIATRNYHPDTILTWMFSASDTRDGIMYTEGQPLDRVPDAWLSLVGLTRDSPNDDLFYEPIRVLAVTKDLPPTRQACLMYFAFIGHLDVEYRDLLWHNDERALWMFGYWLGLLRRYDLWWSRKRIRRDYRAIILWLDGKGVRERPGAEGEMWRVLMRDLEAVPQWHGNAVVSEIDIVSLRCTYTM